MRLVAIHGGEYEDKFCYHLVVPKEMSLDTERLEWEKVKWNPELKVFTNFIDFLIRYKGVSFTNENELEEWELI